MTNEFILFHDACWQQRRLLIAAKCLQDEVARHARSCVVDDVDFLQALLEDIQIKSLTIANIMFQFASEVQANASDMRFSQGFALIESSCHELLFSLDSIANSTANVARELLNEELLAQSCEEIAPYTQAIRKLLGEEKQNG